jgi:transcriptional regulator with XRE-family HTH domain
MDQTAKSKNDTDWLMKKVQSVHSITGFLRGQEGGVDYPEIPELSTYLDELREKRGIRKEQLFVRSGISSVYGHEVFRGVKRPTRDRIIALAVGLELDVEETQTLLKYARHAALYPKIRRDAVICFALSRHEDLVSLNITLNENKLPTLGDYK